MASAFPNQQNLTIETGVVRPLSEPVPVPNHYLVVFEQVASEKKYRETLEPGQPFVEPWGRRLLGKGNSLIAYAVAMEDALLEDRFHFACPAWRGAGPVTLHASLQFTVANPEAVATGIEQDPRRRLENQVKELACRAIARLKWEAIEYGELDLEQEVLSAESTDKLGERLPHEEILRNFAPTLGLALENLRFTWSFPIVATEAEEAKADHQRAKELHTLESERLAWEEAKKSRLAEFERERENLDSRAKRMRELADEAVKSLTTAMNQVAQRIETPVALREAVQEMVALQNQVSAMALPSADGADERRQIPGALSEAEASVSTSRGRLSTLIGEIVALLEELTCEEAQRRRVVSKGLHLVAEASLGEEASREQINRLAEGIREECATLVETGAMESNRQRTLLNRLSDPEALQRELAN